jgi:KaiC/GvpD/RAD55 family RecA-like ATPase
MSDAKQAMKEQLISSFREFFACREDAYAEGFPRGDGKYAYRTARDWNDKDLPLSDEAIWSHIQGERIIGVYPLVEGTKTSWLAYDFDGGDDPIADAFRQRDALRGAGFIAYVERSRSGNGAHVWVFFDQQLPAYKVRKVFFHLLLPEFKQKTEKQVYDRMFPNQDNAGTGYGNLIALPYHGEAFKIGNSCFIDQKREPVHYSVFFEKAKKNSAQLVAAQYDKLPQEDKKNLSSGVRNLPVMKLTGALKVCEFCNWAKQAKQRMPNQNQEPEFYALACQFAQLEGGKRLTEEYGHLHPYSDDRINEKWNRAVEKNMPDTCASIRQKFGDCGKRCDVDFKIKHPYELARVSFSKLQTSEPPRPESYSEVAVRVVERAERVARHEEDLGIAYGWDQVDDLTEMRNGDLIIMAALPSIGKTATVSDIVANVGSRGIPSYLASIEMSSEAVVQRQLARRTLIDATRISKGLLDDDEWKKLHQAAKDPFPFYVDDKCTTLEQILDVFGELVHKHGKGPAFVDYLQIVGKEDNENQRDATTRVVTGLKSIAKFLDIPIICLSQLNRSAEKDERDGEDPLDAWLAEGAAIERVADVIFYLRGKRGTGVVPRRLRIHKERYRGVAGTEINMDFFQNVFRFEPRSVRNPDFRVNADVPDELF